MVKVLLTRYTATHILKKSLEKDPCIYFMHTVFLRQHWYGDQLS